MNDRIRELAEQAGYYLYDLTETHECKTVETDSTDEWITLEKFAELIVRECIDWCNANSRDDGTAQRIAEDIKKDFGVKE